MNMAGGKLFDVSIVNIKCVDQKYLIKLLMNYLIKIIKFRNKDWKFKKTEYLLRWAMYI